MISLKKKIFVGLIGVFFFATTILMLYGFLKTPQFDREWREKSATSTGVVVGSVKEFRNRTYVQYPIVEYSLPDGEIASFTSKVWFSTSVYKVGSVVPITYAKDDPVNNVYIDYDPKSNGMKIALLFMVVVFLGAAIMCFWWLGKNWKNKKEIIV